VIAVVPQLLRRTFPPLVLFLSVLLLVALTQVWAGEAPVPATTPAAGTAPSVTPSPAVTPVVAAPSPAITPPGITPSPLTVATPRDYTLYPGDLLKVEVFDHVDLTTTLRIPANGIVPFPLIGEVTGVVGRSVGSFTGEVSKRLLDGFIRQAVVTATVIEFSPRFVYVMGHVAKPGGVELSPFIQLTAMQSIGQAGGFLEDANRTGTQVIRDDPMKPGAKIGLPVPVTDKVDSLVGDIELQPNDIIIVPRLDRVYIIGHVGKPGAVNLPSQEVLTVSKAVSLAGGFSQYAKQGDVQLMRSGKRVQVVDVRAILTGDAKVQDPVLEPGDTVFVPESRF
jgi:polysaccharide export outer membrane protein